MSNALITGSPYLRPNDAWPLSTLAFLCIACAVFFWHPLALLMLVCLFAVVNPTNDFKWLFLIAACALFATLNVSREIAGDLITYVDIQDYTSAKPFYTLLDKDELQLISSTYRLTEIGFYAPFWIIGQVISDSKTAICLMATLAIYIPTFLGLTIIGKSENWSRGLLLTVALFTFFAGINFVQSTHLIRQYISAAVLFCAFALFLTGRRNKWRAVFVALCACSIHNGTALLIPLVAFACWSFQYGKGAERSVPGSFLRVVGIAAILAMTMVLIPILQGALLKDEVPNINAGHFAVVGAFFIIAQIAVKLQHMRVISIHYASVAFLVIYILSLGFYILGLPLFALRYFAYLEWLYGLMVCGIMFHAFRHSPGLQMFARFTLCLAASAILIGRISVAEWVYGPGDNNFLSWDFFQVAQLVSR